MTLTSGRLSPYCENNQASIVRVLCFLLFFCFFFCFFIIIIIELAQLSCIWTEVLKITNLMLSCRGVYSPARRAPLRGERHWRGAAAAQNKHYVMMSLLINYYFLHFCLFLNFNFYFLICFKLFFFIDTPVGRSFILL